MHTFKMKLDKPRLLVIGVACFVLLATTTGYALHTQSKKNNVASNSSGQKSPDDLSAGAAAPTNSPKAANSPGPASTPTSQATPKPAAEPAKTAPTSPIAKPPAVVTPPPVSTTNCLSANPSVYEQYYTHLTNSGYLQTNSYVDTTKLYAALQFAGLLDEIDAKQVVVFAMSDYAFNNLSAAQLAWMNQSPENMRSVLGWQITTGCVTWNAQNPVKNATGPVAINTLNGTVTYTPGSPGKLDNTSIGIWDWHTSNGTVTITGFIHPPQVP